MCEGRAAWWNTSWRAGDDPFHPLAAVTDPVTAPKPTGARSGGAQWDGSQGGDVALPAVLAAGLPVTGLVARAVQIGCRTVTS